MAEKELILDIPLEHEMNILGEMDKYLRKLQRQFSVQVVDRDGLLKIVGEEENAEKTKEVLLSLLKLSEKGTHISEQNVDYAISLTVKEGKADQLLSLEEDLLHEQLSESRFVRRRSDRSPMWIRSVRI